MAKEKVKGVLAELKIFSKEGNVLDSEIVFKPYCEVYLDKLHDYLGQTRYLDIGAVIDEFGIDTVEKVVGGEVVEVERDLPEDARIVSCPKTERIVKRSSEIRYPWPGARREYLIRESILKQIYGEKVF